MNARDARPASASCSAENVKSIGLGRRLRGSAACVGVDKPHGLRAHGRGHRVPRRAAGLARRRAPPVPDRLVRRRRDRPPRPTASTARRPAGSDWQRRLDDGRWAAINWPRDWHGREATPVQNAIYAEEMARVKAPGIYNANGIWQIGPMILQWGTQEQQTALAPRASSRPTSTGARASASPRPARTSPTCARSRSPTATTTS